MDGRPKAVEIKLRFHISPASVDMSLSHLGCPL